ncbi:class I SAM-dependent methyltransferase [candidate division KSB1 bacterium]
MDIGCGSGVYLEKYKGSPKTGIDISFQLLKKAKRRNSDSFFIAGDADNLSFLRSEITDNIICTEVLEHLISPENFLDEVRRILKPNGYLFISTPNYKKNKPGWIEIPGELKKFNLNGVKGRYYHTAYKPEELKQIFEETAFETIEYGTFEKEIKVIAKLPAVIKIILDNINNRLFKNVEFEIFNEKIFQTLCRYNYIILKPVISYLTDFVKEGVRSYIVLKKND